MAALDPDRIGRLERLVGDLQELAMHWNGKLKDTPAHTLNLTDLRSDSLPPTLGRQRLSRLGCVTWLRMSATR